MEDVFKDRTKPRSQHPKNKPVDGKNSPWNFTAPSYDQRSSCFVNAGTDYDTGFAQPIGNEVKSNFSVERVSRHVEKKELGERYE